MRCSICNRLGHNRRSCNNPTSSVVHQTLDAQDTRDDAGLGAAHSTRPLPKPDAYDQEMVRRQYGIHRSYVQSRAESTQQMGVKVRLPSIPEDISENIVKFILHHKLRDPTSRWDCGKGDLHSQIEGRQECKCFTSDGPLSFTPTSEWDVIYFLDARDWLSDRLVLHRIRLKRTSDEWMRIQVSKTQTFADQTLQGRRPRINWNDLQKQVAPYCTEVYRGTFDEIFVPTPAPLVAS